MMKIKVVYGMGFREFVKDQAGIGNSKTSVAKMLDCDRSWFVQLLKRYGVNGVFREQKDMNVLCRGGWEKGRKRK